MGRKKRKVDSSSDPAEEVGVSQSNDPPGDVETIKTEQAVELETAVNDNDGAAEVEDVEMIINADATPNVDTKKATSSSYAMTSHSGELIQEDVYVSDGSLDSDDDDEMEIMLTSSRMGIMRRGLHHQMMALQQPNRQWKRQEGAANAADIPAATATSSENSDGTILSPEEAEELKRKREEEELSQLDPAQRAARLLVEKQRRELEAKIEEKRRENEENVMRDPTLFSKRTAFDIRFDQIDDKPWERGVGFTDNHSDFFNYGLSEEDWLEYAAQQLVIRQELIDAYRQKRLPDPAIVPIQPPVVKKEESTASTTAPTPVATSTSTSTSDAVSATIPVAEEVNKDALANSNDDIKVDPVKVEPVETPDKPVTIPSISEPAESVDPKQPSVDLTIGVGGAWGAGAAPGSFLARLIEEQEKGGSTEESVTTIKEEPVEKQPERVPQDSGDIDSYHGKEYVKSERDYGRSKRRGSGGDVDDTSYSRDADDSSHYDNYDNHHNGRHWNRSAPPPPSSSSQEWHSAPPTEYSSHRTDAYNSYPPSHGTGYHGRGGGGGGRGGRGGGGRFPPRGGGRGGRGYHNRDASSGNGDYYQEPQHGGWKRPRQHDDESSRRRY